MCFAPQRRALFRDLNFQKWSETPNVFNILTSKCASRHNGVHFFDISTSKSAPTMVCFVHFDLEMCFAPQRRALFRHLNCQKWSAPLLSSNLSLLSASSLLCFSSVHIVGSSTSKLPSNMRSDSLGKGLDFELFNCFCKRCFSFSWLQDQLWKSLLQLWTLRTSLLKWTGPLMAQCLGNLWKNCSLIRV